MKNNFECLNNTMMGMTYEEVEEAVKNNAIVLFPVGVVEAHGPHLSLNTVMNLISRSKKEKYIMTPLSFVAAICFWITALQM